MANRKEENLFQTCGFDNLWMNVKISLFAAIFFAVIIIYKSYIRSVSQISERQTEIMAPPSLSGGGIINE